jgi:hypothetical protein
MQKGNLTREQAVSIMGESAVSKVEGKNCEPTNRAGYNGACQDDELCEWSASVSCKDTNGDDCTLVAYYYTTNEQDEAMAEADGDGSAINWDIEGFEIV